MYRSIINCSSNWFSLTHKPISSIGCTIQTLINAFTTESQRPEINTDVFNDLYKKTMTNEWRYYFTKELQKIKDNSAEGKKESSTRLLSQIALNWKALSADQKLELSNEVKSFRKKSEQELNEFFKNYTEEEKNEFITKWKNNVMEEKLNKIDNKSKITLKDEEQKERLMKKLKKDKQSQLKLEWLKYNKPQNPIRNYWLEYLDSLDRGDASYKDFLRGASAKWKQLPVQEQDRFKELNSERREQYKADLAQWEALMIEQGLTHLVSPSVLKKNGIIYTEDDFKITF